MNRFGHVGFTMLTLSPLTRYLGVDFVILATVFALLPDIDILLRLKHREYTHNLTFAALSAFVAFVISGARLALAALAGITTHIIADLLTIQKFAPLYPISRKRVAFKLFRSDNPIANSISFILGFLSLVYFTGR